MSLPNRDEWVARFEEVPPTFYRLLAELLQEVQAERERERGVERRGRRPALAAGSINDVTELVYPKRSEKPFPEALREATDQPMWTVARIAGMNPGSLHKLITGARPLTKSKIEAIAKAIHVDPGYFHEYRVLVVHEAIDSLLTPRRSLQAYTAIEQQHHQMPRPRTPNAPYGYGTRVGSRNQTIANQANTVEGFQA